MQSNLGYKIVSDAIDILLNNAVENKVKNESKRNCPKCGRQYTAPPAISRSDNKTEICPVCGAEEAIAFLPEEQRAEIIKTIETAERAAGRID